MYTRTYDNRHHQAVHNQLIPSLILHFFQSLDRAAKLKMGDWSNGLCGCFNNIGMCIFTYVVPCYTHGKIAEAVGDDCLLCGLVLLVPLLNIYALITTRGKVRESKGIDGSLISDLFFICCCGFCAIMQEAQEMSVSTPLGAGESIART